MPWTNTISNLKGGIVGPFYKKEYQKTNQTGLRVEKVIKRKCNKVIKVKWNGYNNSFNIAG